MYKPSPENARPGNAIGTQPLLGNPPNKVVTTAGYENPNTRPAKGNNPWD